VLLVGAAAPESAPASVPAWSPASAPSSAPASAPTSAPASSPASAPASVPAPGAPRALKSPATAASWTLLWPGAGHFYLGDVKSGIGLTLLGGVTLAATIVTAVDGWPPPAAGVAPTPFDAFADPTFFLSSIWFQNAWLYSIYAAWRDARALRHAAGAGPPPPEGSLLELVAAPVTPRVLAAPEVAIGLPVLLGLGLLASWAVTPALVSPRGTLFTRARLDFMGATMSTPAASVLGEAYFAALFLPVAIGEETFFRGYFQPSLADRIGPWGALVVSSVVFGLSHAANALVIPDPATRVRYLAIGVPFLTVVGGYLGWVAMRRHYSMAFTVAIHFWYDFLLSTIGFALDPDSQPFVLRMTLPL
jgi:membrane protease YdiL (CAAX protease family)